MTAALPQLLLSSPGSCSSSDDAEFQTLVLSAVLGFIALAAVGLALLFTRWDDWYSHSAGAGEKRTARRTHTPLSPARPCFLGSLTRGVHSLFAQPSSWSIATVLAP